MKGVWKVAKSDAYTISTKPSSVTETPMAGPLTAATIGFGKSIKAQTNFLTIQEKRISNMNKNIGKYNAKNYYFILELIPGIC